MIRPAYTSASSSAARGLAGAGPPAASPCGVADAGGGDAAGAVMAVLQLVLRLVPGAVCCTSAHAPGRLALLALLILLAAVAVSGLSGYRAVRRATQDAHWLQALIAVLHDQACMRAAHFHAQARHCGTLSKPCKRLPP